MTRMVAEQPIYGATFDRWMPTRKHEAAWLQELRTKAKTRFQEGGWPTTKQEFWKHTNLKPLIQGQFEWGGEVESSQASEAASDHQFEDQAGLCAVFVDGVFRPEASRLNTLPEGLRVMSMAEALDDNVQVLQPHLGQIAVPDALSDFNTAAMHQGALIHLKNDVVCKQPLQLLFLATEAGQKRLIHPRVLVVAEAHSQLTLVETFAGNNQQASAVNAVSEVSLADGSNVTHYLCQFENEHSHHIHQVAARLGRDAKYCYHGALLGGSLVRNNIHVSFQQTGGQAWLNGLYVGHNRQHMDNQVAIYHQKPHCQSHQNFRGILDDQSRGVFTGRVEVAQDAQKTDANQNNRNLLLSEDARVDSQPQLEIYADDVKCSHGSTTGYLDPDAHFYLVSRGIEPQAARQLLIYAFAHQVVDSMELEPVRKQLEKILVARFGAAMALGVFE